MPQRPRESAIDAITLAPPSSATAREVAGGGPEIDEYTVLTPLVHGREVKELKLDAQSAMVLSQADGLTPLRAIFQRIALPREEILTVVAELCARGIACLGPLQATPPPLRVKTSEIRLREVVDLARRKVGRS
jgi:hypothetical protein